MVYRKKQVYKVIVSFPHASAESAYSTQVMQSSHICISTVFPYCEPVSTSCIHNTMNHIGNPMITFAYECGKVIEDKIETSTPVKKTRNAKRKDYAAMISSSLKRKSKEDIAESRGE